MPSPSLSFVQVNFGLALDRFEDAKLNEAFATPPKLEVPATPYNLKYLYFLPACKLFISTRVAGGVKVSEEIGAVFKLSQSTLSTDPWNRKVLAASVEMALKSRFRVRLVISISPFAVYFKISLPAKNCPDLKAEKVANEASMELINA